MLIPLSQVPIRVTGPADGKPQSTTCKQCGSDSHSVRRLSFFVSEVGRVSPQTCSGPLATDQQKMGEVVRAIFGREGVKGFVDVQACSGRVTLYLIIHFHAWTSESPGELSKKTHLWASFLEFNSVGLEWTWESELFWNFLGNSDAQPDLEATK